MWWSGPWTLLLSADLVAGDPLPCCEVRATLADSLFGFGEELCKCEKGDSFASFVVQFVHNFSQRVMRNFYHSLKIDLAFKKRKRNIALLLLCRVGFYNPR